MKQLKSYLLTAAAISAVMAVLAVYASIIETRPGVGAALAAVFGGVVWAGNKISASIGGNQ